MDRHWLPAILIGFSVLLALAFAVFLSPQGQELLEKNPDVREVVTPTAPITEAAYQAAVVTLLADYATNAEPEDTYNALIAVRVPASMLNVHYELVIAFGKLMSGEEADGEARLAALKAQYPWLAM